MKKLVLSGVVAAALAVSSMAESNYYVGAGYNMLSGTHTIPYNINYGTSLESQGAVDHNDEDKIDDLDADGSTIKFGWDNQSYRLEISYSSIKVEGTGNMFSSYTAYSDGTTDVTKTSQTFDEKITGIDFDVVVPFSENELKPYVTAGIGSYNWGDFYRGLVTSTATYSVSGDRSGLAYNLGAGLLYSIGALELDIAYKWKKISWEDVTLNLSNTDFTYADEDTTLSGLYAGINYHF